MQAAKTSMNRRVNHHTRQAVSDIERFLFDPYSVPEMFKVAIEKIATLSQAKHCELLVASNDAGTQISRLGLTNLQSLCLNHTSSFVNSDEVKALIAKSGLSKLPYVLSAPFPKNHINLLNGCNDFSTLCVLPIVVNDDLHGVFFLSKHSGLFDEKLVTRVMPVLTAVAYVIKTAQEANQQVIGLHSHLIKREYLNNLLASSPIATIVCTFDKQIHLMNPAAVHLFGEEHNVAGDFIGLDVDTFLPDFDSLFHNSYCLASESTKVHDGARMWHGQNARRSNDALFKTDLSIFQHTTKSGHFFTLQIQDASKSDLQRQEIQTTTQQLSALTDLVPVAIVNIDKAWNCIYSNDKWHDYTGLSRAETKEQKWINGVHREDIEVLLTNLRATLKSGEDFKCEVRLVNDYGRITWSDFSARVLFDETGFVSGFLATFQDVTERILNEAKLKQIAQFDELTGLTNRNLFQSILEKAFEWSAKSNLSLTLMFIDLDGFKDINDTRGHDIGDLLLQQVSERLVNKLSERDIVARFGGDEFVILLDYGDQRNSLDMAHLKNLVNELIKTVSKPFIIEGVELFTTASIGIATGSHTTSTPKQLLKHADVALYAAKKEGKNTFQFFNIDLDQRSRDRVELTTLLRNAVLKNAFELRFQPIADVDSELIIGCECLLRFRGHDGEFVPLNAVIPILEETGMIVQVGEWVIEETCRKLEQWQKAFIFPKDGFVSFNVSPKQLLDTNLGLHIGNCCKKYDINPNVLVMEITESVIIDRPEKVAKVLQQMSLMGIKFALDDFGTGFSSLSYLQKYPFDYIKIDRSFVEDILIDENDAKITQAIVLLAKSLGIKVTAEGVTSPECLEKLASFGADHYQGFYLGKPHDEANLIDAFSLH